MAVETRRPQTTAALCVSDMNAVFLRENNEAWLKEYTAALEARAEVPAMIKSTIELTGMHM